MEWCLTIFEDPGQLFNVYTEGEPELRLEDHHHDHGNDFAHSLVHVVRGPIL